MTPPRARNAEEAVLQADAKERIRTARGIRHGGIATMGFGGLMLTRVNPWWRSAPFLAVHIHGGPSFILSLQTVIGIAAVVIGPILIAAGQSMLVRANRAAASNPITAGISDDTVPP